MFCGVQTSLKILATFISHRHTCTSFACSALCFPRVLTLTEVGNLFCSFSVNVFLRFDILLSQLCFEMFQAEQSCPQRSLSVTSWCNVKQMPVHGTWTFCTAQTEPLKRTCLAKRGQMVTLHKRVLAPLHPHSHFKHRVLALFSSHFKHCFEKEHFCNLDQNHKYEYNTTHNTKTLL